MKCKLVLIVMCAVLLMAGCSTQSSTNIEVPVEKVKASSYEDILEDYSQKLRDATPVLIEEYNKEAEANQDGLEGLAKLSSEKTSELAKISNDGIQEMAKLYYKQSNGKYEEYEEWAGKLYDVYMEEAMKIHDAYMDSAL